MSGLEESFPGLFVGLNESQHNEIVQSSNEAVLLQASLSGPEEYLRVAKEIGCNVVDIVIQLPSHKEVHYQRAA